MNEVAATLFDDRRLPNPVGVLRADSPLARLWRNRLVPLKTVHPIRVLGADTVPGGTAADRQPVHIADLAECTPEDFAALVALLPDISAASVVMFERCRELAIDADHFEAVV